MRVEGRSCPPDIANRTPSEFRRFCAGNASKGCRRTVGAPSRRAAVWGRLESSPAFLRLFLKTLVQRHAALVMSDLRPPTPESRPANLRLSRAPVVSMTLDARFGTSVGRAGGCLRPIETLPAALRAFICALESDGTATRLSDWFADGNPTRHELLLGDVPRLARRQNKKGPGLEVPATERSRLEAPPRSHAGPAMIRRL
jgi:hypothetical protein